MNVWFRKGDKEVLVADGYIRTYKGDDHHIVLALPPECLYGGFRLKCFSANAVVDMVHEGEVKGCKDLVCVEKSGGRWAFFWKDQHIIDEWC